MGTIHGFQLKSDHHITELNTRSRHYVHTKTGAELLSLTNDDENKVFGIVFATPPSNSTGIAHILEHSVLCGSRKYPVKEPFVELLKGSLHTFLNAFTYPDKTCYPVASQNLQDFYNLIDVYLDAVFYPRLTPFIFQQEGWHFELEDPEKPLSYKGVVFNEMKGAYSSPDNLLREKARQSLFPDNPYGFDSGGDPKEIPNLSFEQFEAFHHNYYHPSNARIYFYGDDDPEERLRLVDEYLKDFDPMPLDTTIPLQSLLDGPKHIVLPFMAGEAESAEKNGMITCNWLLPEATDVQTNFALQVLEYILLGMPASPLRKALIDSGLGEDIAGEGLGTELRQMYFSTGLKGVEVENVKQVEGLIMETLTSLAQKGIDPLTVEAALNTVEFRYRENNTGHFPQGLLLMLRSLTTWLYGGDPLSLLSFEAPLEAIKSGAQSENRPFEKIIRRLFVDNPHRTTLILQPDRDLRRIEEIEEKDRLDRARQRMSTEDLHGLVKNTLELKRLQGQPDPPEALASIPVLKHSDLDKENKTIPLTHLEWQGIPILFHDLFTNGVTYLDLGFDLHALPAKYLPYVPLFGRALTEMGTAEEDFVSLTQRISSKTGGINAQTFTSSVKNTQRSTSWLFLRSKAMVNQTEDLITILRDVLLTARLDNQERFLQMLLEEKAQAEQQLIPQGHQVVNLRLKSHFGEALWAAEQMGGISYLFFLRELVRAVEKDWSSVLTILEEMRCRLISRRNMLVNVTLSENGWGASKDQLYLLIDALPNRPVTETTWVCNNPLIAEGMTIPSQINFVGKGADLYQLGYGFHGSSLVITRYLRTAWLWERVRVLGGAYGVFCLFDRPSGVLTFISYRDPNLMETLEAFDQAASFLAAKEIGKEELLKGIIGAIGDLDRHMLPDAKGFASMIRYLIGDTEDDRRQMRDEILCTQAADFKRFAGILEKVKRSGVVKIVGSSSAVEATATKRPGWLHVVKVI